MAYNANFVEARETQYGHRIIVQNEKGDWHLFGKGRPPAIISGTPVTFEAQKSQNGRGWNYANLRTTGEAGLAAGPGPAAAKSVDQGGFRPNSDEQIFITGIVGRAMGSGQFSVTDIVGLTLAAAEAWRALQEWKANPPRQTGAGFDDRDFDQDRGTGAPF